MQAHSSSYNSSKKEHLRSNRAIKTRTSISILTCMKALLVLTTELHPQTHLLYPFYLPFHFS